MSQVPLADWITHRAALTPQQTALRFAGRSISYASLAALQSDYVAALAAAGVTRGACVAYIGYNSPAQLALLFACARLGALFMPLNWRLAAPEHQQMFEDCPPTVLCVEAPFIAATEAVAAARPGLQCVAMSAATDELPAGWAGEDEFVARGHLARGQAAAPATGADAAQAPLLICYTSGSTGKPKGVLLSAAALQANAANSVAMHELTADDVILTTLPLFHVGGLNIQTTPALSVGATVVLHARFDADATFDALQQDGITLTVLVPAQFDMMIASPRWRDADFSTLRFITTGSSIIPPQIIAAVHDRGIPLAQVYGSTETCPIAACQSGADAMATAGSAGRRAAHCQVRIIDEHGDEVAAGVTGEIVVRGANVMSGYWHAAELTAAAFVDGWYRTGDMGHWDAQDYLWVDGRKKEMIISGGENIYPAEVENVLYACSDIAEATVIGRPDARWGEIVVAVVVRKDGSAIDKEAVLKAFEGRIARYKHPKDVMFVAQLPKTALGKVRREEVRRIASAANQA